MTGPAAKTSASAGTRSRRASPVRMRSAGMVVRRACRCGATADGECKECERERKPTVQRSASGPGAIGAVPSSVYDTLNMPGEPLAADLRSRFEPRYQQDFSNVRVHTDARAAESARSINARAYTVGQHIAFDRGEYQPGTAAGQRLIAHELAHTVQQSGVQRFATEGLSVDASNSAFECEAEAAADHAMSAAPPAARPALSAPVAGAPARVARLARDWQDLPAPLPVTGHVVSQRAQLDPTVTNPDILAFKINKLLLPREKGPVEALYRAKAAADALEGTVRFTGNTADGAQAGLWQARADTDNLRRNWLIKIGWNNLTAAEVGTRWNQAGGIAPTAATFPRVNPRVATAACDMDHIVELQLGGTNVPENLQVLNAAENQGAGRSLWAQLRDLASEIRATLPTPRPREIILSFANVEQVGGTVAPAAASGPGAGATCTEVECAIQDQLGASGTSPTAGAAGEALVLEVGGTTATIGANPSPADTDLLNSTPANLAAAELIPGIILSTFHRPATSETCDGFIESQAYFKRSKPTRVPLALQANQAALVFNSRTEGGQRRLSLRGNAHPSVRFTYPYLSTGDLRLSFDPETGLSGEGRLTPSLPLLSSAPMNVEFGQDRLRIFYGAARGPIATPIPGLRLTEATLGLDILPELRPTGRIAFAAGPSGRDLVTGSVEATADTNGLALDGVIIARIPNTDEARGEVHYRNREWSGFIVVSTSQIRFPGVRGGEIRIDFTNEGPVPSGRVDLEVAGQPVTLSAVYRQGRFLFRGEGTFDLPGLNPLVATVETDGQSVSFEGTTGVTLRYMNGTMTVRYRSGEWSGDGTVNVAHGRASGTANVHLSPAGRVYGDGRLQYRITDTLTAGIGILLREDQSVRVSGDITLATIQLFDRFPRTGGRQRLFRTHIGIPILGFSLGPVGDIGLVLAIDPEIGVYYGIGPGELRNTRITTAFDPFAANPNFEFTAGTEIYIPFDAGFYITIPASLSLAAVIASVSAGLEATADIGLRGNFGASASLAYRQSIWTVETLAGIYANPRLALRIDGFLRAAAGFGPFERVAEKRWNLAGWEWGSDMRFGIEFPFRYASNEPFQSPSFDDIRFIKPDIDFTRLLTDVVGEGR